MIDTVSEACKANYNTLSYQSIDENKTGNKYPSGHAHIHKDGYNVPQKPTLPTNEEITMAVENAKKTAQTLVETLEISE